MITCLKNGSVYDAGAIRPAKVHLDEHGLLHGTHGVTEACQIEDAFDLTDGIVIPQAVDAHVHVFDGFGIGAAPDDAGWDRDLDVVIDGGSAGPATLPAMRRIAQNSRTDVRLWLNLSAIGLIDGRVSEAANPALVDRDEILAAATSNPGLVVGFKARLSKAAVGESGSHVMETLDELRAVTALPTTVHIGDTALPLHVILERLHPGDVVCHCFHGRAEGILDVDGTISSAVRSAADRGVLFDVAPGTSHLSPSVLRAAAAQGFWPTLLTTDVSRNDVAHAGSRLDSIASVLLNAGMPLELIIHAVTERPLGFLPNDKDSPNPLRRMLMWRRSTPGAELMVSGHRYVIHETLQFERWRRTDGRRA